MIRENLFGDLLPGHTWLSTPGDLVVLLPNTERGRVFPRPIIDIRENINILWLYFWNISDFYPDIGNIKVSLWYLDLTWYSSYSLEYYSSLYSSIGAYSFPSISSGCHISCHDNNSLYSFLNCESLPYSGFINLPIPLVMVP